MSLGVLNNLSAMYAENNLNNTTNSLNTVLQQLSSGSRINSGADDAAGLSLVDGLQANSQALAQSQTNAQEGVGLLQVADGALSQVTSLLNRAVTLATEASNGTLNSSQDTAANQEYQSILSEVSNIGSTTTYNGQAVFNSNTNIYTGDSSSQGSSVDALNIRTLSSSNLGDTGGTMAYSTGQTAGNVFIDLSNDGTQATTSDSLGASTSTTVININHLVTGADGAVTAQTSAITVGYGTQYANTTQGMMSAINGAGLGLTATFGTAASAGTTAAADANSGEYGGGSKADTGIIITGQGIGTGSNSVGEVGAITVNATGDTLAGTLNIVDSTGKSHALTLGSVDSTDTVANLENTINSAGYGVTASLNTAVVNGNAIGTVLTLTSASSAASASGAGVTDTTVSTASKTVTMAAVLGNSAVSGSTVATIVLNSANDTLGGTLTLDGLASATDFLSTTHGGTSIALGTVGSTDTLANLAQTINNYNTDNSGFDLTATISNSGKTLTVTTNAANAASDVEVAATNTLTETDSTVADAVTGIPTTSGTTTPTIGTLGLSGSEATATDALSGTLTIGSNAAITLGGLGTTDTLQDLAKTINSYDYGVTATYNSSSKDIVFTSANSSIAITGSSIADATATAADGTSSGSNNATAAFTAQSPASIASSYYSVGVSVGIGAVWTSGSAVSDSSALIQDQNTVVGTGSNDATLTYGGTANTGLTSDTSGLNGIATISYTDNAGQSLSASDLSNQTDSQTALTELNSAITDVAAQDGYVGAQINTLNAVSSVLSTQQENVTSAQNAVQATDYASATSNMSKYEILSQTGISALAQANSMSQEVTKLLQ